MTIAQHFEQMPNQVNKSAIEGVHKTVQFKVTGDEPGQYYVVVNDGEVKVHKGVADNADATINTPSDVWLQISSGKLNGAVAFMTGKFQVEGDMMVLMSMQNWFNRPN